MKAIMGNERDYGKGTYTGGTQGGGHGQKIGTGRARQHGHAGPGGETGGDLWGIPGDDRTVETADRELCGPKGDPGQGIPGNQEERERLNVGLEENKGGNPLELLMLLSVILFSIYLLSIILMSILEEKGML